MDEFTKEEIDRINQLYGTDFKDITPDDALLIGRFEAKKAMQETEFKARCEAIKAENEQKLEQSAKEHKLAMSNLELLHDVAMAKLEAAKHGK